MMLITNSYPSRSAKEDALLARREPAVHGPLSRISPENERQLSLYEKDGYLVMRNIFSSSEVEALQSEMDELRKRCADEKPEEAILEPETGHLRSLFSIHRSSKVFSRLCRDSRLLDMARQILDSDLYIHQSRLNYKPGLYGKEFFWHSDFETWHIEDGMPNMRAVSCSVLLTDNNHWNGPLMVIPGSHRTFVSCSGETPEDNYKISLKQQSIGVPDKLAISMLVDKGGIDAIEGPAGTVVFFDANLMHGSNSNISPHPRSNAFFVYNSMDNLLRAPANGLKPRPEFIAARKHIEPLRTCGHFLDRA